MSQQWVEVKEQDGSRGLLPVSPGLLVIGAFGVLLVMVVIGITVTTRGDDVVRDITIAELRADPDAFDGRMVELQGRVTNAYSLPVLDQYGLYEFDDGSDSIFVLTDRGVPPEDMDDLRLTGRYNSAVKLDQQIRRLVEEELGSAAGFVVERLLPGIPLNVVYVRHDRYQLPEGSGTQIIPSG